MSGRKYELTVLICAVFCAVLVYQATINDDIVIVVGGIIAAIGGYHGANIIQKIKGGKQ